MTYPDARDPQVSWCQLTPVAGCLQHESGDIRSGVVLSHVDPGISGVTAAGLAWRALAPATRAAAVLVTVELRLATSLASLATSQLTVELTCATPSLVATDGVTDGPECRELLWKLCAGLMRGHVSDHDHHDHQHTTM